MVDSRSRDASQRAFAAFEEQFLGPRTSDMVRDGAPFELLGRLDPDDRARAARALEARLEEHDHPGGRRLDPWAVEALGRLARLGTPMPDRTVPLLQRLLARRRGSMRAKIALALWQITRDEAMLDVVLALARTSRIGAWLEGLLGLHSELIEVIHCLAQFPQPAARRRLEELGRDPRYLVRYNAELALRLRRSEHGIMDAPEG